MSTDDQSEMSVAFSDSNLCEFEREALPVFITLAEGPLSDELQEIQPWPDTGDQTDKQEPRVREAAVQSTNSVCITTVPWG